MKILEKHQNYIKRVCDEMNINTTQLAKNIGVSPSTINRPMANNDVKHVLSSRTLEKIAEYSGIAIDDASLSESALAYTIEFAQRFISDRKLILASDDFGRFVARLYPLAERESHLNNGVPGLTKLQAEDIYRSLSN